MFPGYLAPTHTCFGFCLLLSAVATPLAAQGIDSQPGVETIIGSKVTEEQTQAAADPAKVIAAIEKTAENVAQVRKTSSLDTVDIVFLTDAAASDGGLPPEIDGKIKPHEADITELRKEIEGNAMLFHAIDSRGIMVRDVLAVAFEQDGKSVVIYAAAKPAG